MAVNVAGVTEDLKLTLSLILIICAFKQAHWLEITVWYKAGC